MSAEVNHALAASVHGRRPNWLSLLCRFLALGPRGWHRFFRDSRILERVTARLRAGDQFGPPVKRNAPLAGGKPAAAALPQGGVVPVGLGVS
jgi:hypothetical protein